jgi:hypothetical protein
MLLVQLVGIGHVAARAEEGEPLERQLLRENPAALAKAARVEGDPVRGAILFYQPQLSCTKCHACGGKEAESPLGPDLARPARGATAGGVGLKVWDLMRSEEYGSAHLHERPLAVTAARLSVDRKTVTLTIPELRPTRGLELWYTVRGADGREVDGLLHGSVQQVVE